MRPPEGTFTLLARYTFASRGQRLVVELRRYPRGELFDIEVLPDGEESAHKVTETYARASIRLWASEGPSPYLTPEGEAFLAERAE